MILQMDPLHVFSEVNVTKFSRGCNFMHTYLEENLIELCGDYFSIYMQRRWSSLGHLQSSLQNLCLEKVSIISTMGEAQVSVPVGFFWKRVWGSLNQRKRHKRSRNVHFCPCAQRFLPPSSNSNPWSSILER